jgi:glutaminyl-tRNA synthetase
MPDETPTDESATGEATSKSDFIREIISSDVQSGKHEGQVSTRFPPEPNGFLHIGHAKSICLNFGVATEHSGITNLRFDDTNPTKEETRYVEAIQEDVRWLGFDWGDRLFFASDYYEQLFDFAVHIVERGKAYVDDQSADEIRAGRGTLTEPGQESPHRNRGVEENLDLLRGMRAGDFPDGSRVLRAKIDMASPNLNMRDPVLYRVLRATHHRTGDDWCIYPMYDFAHPLSDSIEGITHSLCTLEFEAHRPLYDWVLVESEAACRPRQIEFARLNLTHTMVSKRKLLRLFVVGHAPGWDAPRWPPLRALRRRGYTPEAIRAFCSMIGVAKRDSTVDMGKLEYCIREDLNRTAWRTMAVLRPLRIVLTNYPEGQTEELDAVNNPEDASAGTRKVPFSREILVERDDFREEAPKKWFRLTPGREVRLKHAYIIRCDEVIKNEAGEVVELRCSADLDTLGAKPADGRKVKGIIHWVSAPHAVPIEVQQYDRLFSIENPDKGEDYRQNLNPDSLQKITTAYAEAGLADAEPGVVYQFERTGYFCVDPVDSAGSKPVFNRTVTLRDSWAKEQKK